MKQLLGLLIFLAGVTSYACPRTQQRFICPGDAVVDSNGYRGTVDAVNPFQQTISINYGGSSDQQHNVQNVLLGSGCLEMYCVGDKAVDANGYVGKVDAINPYNNSIAINYGGSSDQIHLLQNVSLALGCVMGYCVGDHVVDANGYRGVIDAVNPFNETAAVNYGGSSDQLHNIQNLSSSAYCSTYGDAVRGMKVFPVVAPSKYISSNFHYSSVRPVQ